MAKITKYFTLEELCVTSTGIPNIPDSQAIINLTKIVLFVLNPLRIKANSAIKVISGFRCKEVNAKVKGAVNSQHIEGEATDYVISGMSPKLTFKFTAQNCNDFDQLIYEYDKDCCHVSYSDTETNRNQIMTRKVINGKYVYDIITVSEAISL